MIKNSNIVIIIPAFKPSKKLLPFVQELSSHFEHIIIVNDGSGKEYESIFQVICSKDVVTLTHGINLGKGRALKTAFNYCLTHTLFSHSVITVDADGQHLIHDILRIAEEMEEHPKDLVLGCRAFNFDNVPFRSKFGNNCSRILYKWACGINVSDTQTGLRGIPWEYLSDCVQLAGERYEYETNMLISLKDIGCNIREVKIDTVYEDGNQTSHFNPIKDSAKIYAVVFKYSLSSIFTALVDYLTFSLALLLHTPILPATYLARVVAGIINFAINRRIVFRQVEGLTQQIIKYSLLVLVSGTMSGLAIQMFTNLFPSVSPLFIKIPFECMLYFINYEVQRLYIFTKSKKE